MALVKKDVVKKMKDAGAWQDSFDDLTMAELKPHYDVFMQPVKKETNGNQTATAAPEFNKDPKEKKATFEPRFKGDRPPSEV